MSKRFVLFIGPKQSGKDTAADILIKKKGKARQKVSFAGPLKEICATASGLESKYMHNVALKEKELPNPIVADRRFWRNVKRELVKYLPEIDQDNNIIYNIDRVSLTGVENRVFKTPREMLQQVGTDFIRDKVFTDWHVQAAFSEANLDSYEDGYIYCVTDARFPNEYEFLKEKFGDDLVAYYIERPEAEEELAKATHPSELEILKIKELIPKKNIIKNDGTLEDFEKKIAKLKLPKASGKTGKKASKKKSRFVYGPAKG